MPVVIVVYTNSDECASGHFDCAKRSVAPRVFVWRLACAIEFVAYHLYVYFGANWDRVVACDGIKGVGWRSVCCVPSVYDAPIVYLCQSPLCGAARGLWVRGRPWERVFRVA